jgi:serine/threonine-protein kinase RsbT
MTPEVLMDISTDVDIVTARQRGRELGGHVGFSLTDQTLIATAISELARNIVLYAKRGTISMTLADAGQRRGIIIVAHDEGPGIPNVTQAMQDGFSTSGGLGMGLRGTRRLMDEFEIVSEVGKGTTVTIKKWLR